ncbi:hypothetical protein ACM0IS_01590 [Mycoplasma aquilae ATCC BAA-1896]|uniref:hypothetical protein n=1 Tax=Mycoplasma aquilae TaxID=1312741 RepID=UPI003A8BAF55
MKKTNVKKLVIPVLGATSLILSTTGIVAAAPGTTTNSPVVNFGGDDEAFSGSYSQNNFINILNQKDGSNSESSVFGSFYSSTNQPQLEFNANPVSEWDVFQNRGKYSTHDGTLKNSHYDGTVYLQEITGNVNGNTTAFQRSGALVRKWRATINNWYIPSQPWADTDSNQSNSFAPYANNWIGFGLVLTQDLQLVNNSLKISVVSRNAQHQNMPNSDGVVVVKSNVQNDAPAALNEIFNQFSNNAQPNTFYMPKNTNSSELETFNVSTQTTSVMFPFGYNFFNGAQSPLSKLIQTSPFNFNNFQYNTIYNGSDASAIEIANGPLQAGLLPLFPNSALVNNIANIGTALFGTVSLDSYYNSASKQPAIVIEFETINSQVQSQTGYSFTSPGNSGISAFISLAGSGNDVNNGFVAAHSLSFKRSQYRQINVQINEKTINSWVGFQNKTTNNYIAKGYGYELWYGDNKLGYVPADVVDKAKEQGYDPARKEFKINLKFNVDISKLPTEMQQSYSGFMDPNKLAIKKVYKDPNQAAFFTVSRFPFEWDSQPDNDGQNLGGISLNPNSLKEKGTIEFNDYTQWLGSGSSRLGYDKLMVLNNITAQKQSNTAAPSGSIYQGEKYSYSNTVLLSNQISPFNDAIYNDWQANDFTSGFWDIKLNDVKQGIFDIKNALNALPSMNNVVAYATNPDADSQSNASTKQALTLNSFTSGNNDTNYYSAYLLADDATRKAFMQAYNAINEWENNSTPNFVTEGDTIVDKNNVAQNFKTYVQNIKEQEKQLLNYKGIGFNEGESLTAKQFIDEAFLLIDNAPLYTIQYKSAFKDIILQQTSREDVIKYVNAIVNLANKYNTAKSTYETYLPVSTSNEYVNIQNSKDSSYNAFVFSLNEMKGLLDSFSNYQQTSVNSSIIGAKTLINLDAKINPNNIVEKYQSIISDITAAIGKINGLVNVPANDKQSYINKLWDLVKNDGPYGEKYRLLANYAAREAKIAMVVNTAKMQDLLLQKNKDVAAFAQKFNLNFSSFKYTNNISKSVHEVDVPVSNGTSTATIITYEDIHPDLPFVMNGSKKIYIIPNTTVESASVNYHWQTAAFDYIVFNKKFSEQSETFTKINQEETTQLSSYLFENFVSALSYNSGVLLTEQQVNDFYNNRIALLNTFITQLEELNSAYSSTADTRINKAQYNFYLKKFIDLIFTQSNTNVSTQITDGIRQINGEVAQLKVSMAQLKKNLSTYILPKSNANSDNNFAPNPEQNVFQNGQFYGLGNLDKFALLYEDKYTFKMPENNGKLIALITTALQVLEILPSNINEIANGQGEEAQLVAARTGLNLPSVLRMTVFDTQTPYNWFVYDKDQILKLKDAIADTANSLDGRYNALTNYFEYAVNKYFSSINDKNRPLILDAASTFEKFTKLLKIPEKADYRMENDSIYYKNISNFIGSLAKNEINSLSNLSQEEKSTFNKQISNGSDTIDFYSLIGGRQDQPQWLWKVQAILYQAAQINEYKQGIIDKLATNYPSLNRFQIDSITNTIKEWNLVDSSKWNITNESEAMPSKYSELNKTLHLTASPEQLSNISGANEQMAALRKFYAEKLAPLNIDTPNESELLKLAANRDEFMKLYNPFKDPDQIKEIDWSGINKIWVNIKEQYDKLNGFNVKLQNDINGVDSSIKDFVTQTEFSKTTDISKLPIIPSLEEYNKQYKVILGNLANDVKGKINAQPNLTDAQKKAYASNIETVVNKPEAKFNDLKTTFDGVNQLNTTMGSLKAQWTEAVAFARDNENKLKALNSKTKSDFETALAQANTVFAPYSEENAIVQNISNSAAQELTTKLSAYIQQLTKEILDNEKELIIKQINDTLAPINEQSSAEMQQAKSDLTKGLSTDNTLEDLKGKLQKAKNIVAAKPIYEAIKSAQNSNDKSEDVTSAISTAQQELDKLVNQEETPAKETVQKVADDLNNAVKLSELKNQIAAAQKVQNPSQELTDAINTAQSVANNKETNKYDAQIAALKDAMKKEPLYKAIANAQKENETLKDPSLTSAIQSAQKIANSNDLSDQDVQKAVKALNDELAKAKGNKELIDRLSKAITAAENQNNGTPTGLLHDLIESAKKIVAQGPSANATEISKATKQLEYATELDKLIKVNTQSQAKVAQNNRSREMNSNITDVDGFINAWTEQINNNISALPTFESNAEFKDNVNAKIAKTYQTTNANDLYKTADELTAANPEPFTKDLKPYFNNFAKNASELYNQIPASVSNDKFDLNAGTNAQALSNALNANANYYELAKLVEQAKEIKENEQSQALKDALADANTILGVKNSELTVAANSDLNSTFNPIVNTLKQTNLKDKTNKANELLAQAKSDLASAINKNALTNSLANAKEIMGLLNDGKIVIPENDKNIELSIEERKQQLQQAITNATQALNTNPEQSQAFYNNAANELDKANLIAKELIRKLKETLNSEVTNAQKISPEYAELTNSIKTAEELIKAPTSTAAALVNAIYDLKKLEAKAKLNNAINSVPEELANSSSYKELALAPAQTVLNNPNSTIEDFNNATSKLDSDKNKAPLFNAYDQAIKASTPVDPKLASAIEQAKTILTDPNNEYLTANKQFFEEKAKELIKLLSNNNLNNLVNKAELVQPKSAQLTDALEKAKKAQETIETNTAEQNQTAIDALQDALNKNTLQNTISNAEKLLNSFTPKEGQQATEESTKNKNALENAIQVAKAALTSPSNSTEEQFNTAVGELQKVVTASDKVLSDAKNELVKQAKELNQKVQDGTLKPSAGLSAAIQKDLNPSETDNYLDYVQAKKELTYLQDSNNLANAINSMPQLDPNISGINTTNISQASQNTLANKELAAKDYGAQADKQNALNDVINAANNIQKLDSLNQAQKNNIYNALQEVLNNQGTKSLTDVQNEINKISQDANALNEAMKELRNTYNSISPALKELPLSSINYTYADDALQNAYNTALTSTKNVTANPGTVLGTNQAQDVTELNKQLKEALTALNGNNNFAKIKSDAEAEMKSLNDSLNSNQFFNAPTALQNKYKDALKKAQQALNDVTAMTSATDKTKTATLESALADAKELQAEINKFSNEKFNDGTKDVPEIQDVLNNLPFISPSEKETLKNEYNNTTNYNDAQGVISKAKQLNDSLSKQASSLNDKVNALVNNLPNINKQNLTDAMNQLKDLKDKVAPDQLQNASDLLNAINDIDALNQALAAYEKANVHSENYDATLNNLQSAIAKMQAFSNKQSDNPLFTKVQETANKLIAQGNGLIKLVNSLINNDKEQFQEAINTLEQSSKGQTYKEFGDVVNNNDYFGILSTAKNKYTNKQAKDLLNILSSSAYNKMPNVVTSTMLKDINTTASFPWWAYLLIVSGTLWIVGIITFAFRKK